MGKRKKTKSRKGIFGILGPTVNKRWPEKYLDLFPSVIDWLEKNEETYGFSVDDLKEGLSEFYYLVTDTKREPPVLRTVKRSIERPRGRIKRINEPIVNDSEEIEFLRTVQSLTLKGPAKMYAVRRILGWLDSHYDKVCRQLEKKQLIGFTNDVQKNLNDEELEAGHVEGWEEPVYYVDLTSRGENQLAELTLRSLE